MTEEERTAAAMTLWHDEKGLATTIIVLGWLAKVYICIWLMGPGAPESDDFSSFTLQPCYIHTPFTYGKARIVPFPSHELPTRTPHQQLLDLPPLRLVMMRMMIL